MTDSSVDEFCFPILRNGRVLIVFLRQKRSQPLRGNRRFVCYFVVIFMSEKKTTKKSAQRWDSNHSSTATISDALTTELLVTS